MKKPFAKRLKQEQKNLFFNIIFVVLAITIVILFHENIPLTFALELILGIIGLLKWKSKRTLAIFIFAGLFGPTAEAIVIYKSQAWAYAFPTFVKLIPEWLFLVWANAGAFIYEMSKEIHKLGVNK